jgi:hypothetical protein
MRTDTQMRGRVLALQAMVFLGSTPIGGPIMGIICQLWSPRAALLVGAVACWWASAWGVRHQNSVSDPSQAIV